MTAVNSVGIIGAGTMGAALAQKFAQEKFQVVLLDREDRFLKKGIDSITATLNEGIQRSIFTEDQKNAVLQRITATTDMQRLNACSLIIEAVFEDKKVKQELFKNLCDTVPENTIIATNTSSFSVTELADAVSAPERFIGLHFFYHAAKNRLVEVVRGEKTSDATFNRVMWLMKRSGKDPITCRDAQGFVVNRFFVPWLNEAVRMLEENIAGMAAIDAVACKTFGCGMGPFALMNATGVPIAFHAQKTLYETYGDFYKPAESLRRQSELNQPWDIENEGGVSDAAAGKIAERLVGVVFLVCGQLLDEIVCTAGDINRGARIGLRWRKGPLDLFNRSGEQTVKEQVSDLAKNRQIPVPQSLTSDQWQANYIHTERVEKTGIITINRPEDLNALNPQVISQLQDAFSRFDEDEALDTIVITGQGKAFVAGADIRFFIDHIRKNTISEITSFTAAGQKLFQQIDDSDKTVIAAINGLALGGGLELALAADYVVALPNSVMAFPETGIGIYPGLGGTQRTVKRVGRGLAKFLIYTGNMIPAQSAAEMGLIDAVIDWEELRNLINGKFNAETKPVVLSEKWRQTADFFERFSVADFLSDGAENNEEFNSEQWQKTVKKIRYKAPRALQIAEKLINEQKGPASEQKYLEKIFSTEDALAGLQSVGGKPPKFSGR